MTRDPLEGALEGLLSGRRERQQEAHETLLDLAEEPARREAVAERAAELVEHKDAYVRGTAYVALAVARRQKAALMLGARARDTDAGARCDLAFAASLLGEAGRPLALTLVKDEVFEVRFEAALALAALKGAESIDVLLEGAERRATRLEALEALRLVAAPRALGPVRKVFEKTFLSGFERAAAAGALAAMGDDEARRWLLARVKAGRGDERGMVIEMIGDLGLKEAEKDLLAVLSIPADAFRGAAARALGALGCEAAVGPLSQVLADEAAEPETRMDAAEGLALLDTDAARAEVEAAARRFQNPDMKGLLADLVEAMRRGPSETESES